MSPRHPRWADPVDPATWRAPPGRPRQEAVAEQDRAAGGRDRRLVVLAGKRRACASIELKHVNSKRRIYAYLRYSIDGRTVNRYVGEAHGATREEHLCEAWKAAHALRLLDPDALVEGSAPRGDAGAVAPRSAEGP